MSPRLSQRRLTIAVVDEGTVVGRVIGTEDATPLEVWVGVQDGAYLQLDDVGARFDTDVFLIEDGVLFAETAEAAQVAATRFEPEIFVPPLPGEAVRKA